MPKVSIVFDRLRIEEKMLLKQATEMGIQVEMIDAKSSHINTEKTTLDFGDGALERCISYFRGLHYTAYLEFLNVPVINKLAVASICGNKMLMTLKLRKHNVPTPSTFFAFTRESAIDMADTAKYPLVIKPLVGSWGRGVAKISDRETLEAVTEAREISDGPYDRIYYLQKLVKRPPRDIRVITVGEYAIAAMYRTSSDGFKTNIALGADPQMCKITKEMEDLAIKSSKAVGGGILGVDMMEDKERGLVAHEVNNTVEFKGISKVTDKNIPKIMLEFLLESTRK
ncbi:MAG: lysine biosynthesis enzyme LysX [Cenarchaeum symbiont of Oopsacas minuta]|nr:lysine biosynthesis enzyme LysX [Cenarchaeum symbiont of Oopsacas minuta]